MDQASPDNETASQPESKAAHTQLRPGSGRLTLLLIAGIPVVVILASTWMWFYVASGKLDLVGALGTSNSGVLVQPPRQSLEADWKHGPGQAFALVTPPKWTMVIPNTGANCDAACEALLYNVRQIHSSLGKELARVQRLLVTTQEPADMQLAVTALSDERPVPESFAAYLQTEQRGMDVVTSSAASFSQMFPELAEFPQSWYLMDPSGWVMMRYDPSISYKDVISDLKFLIKNSNG